MSGKRGGAWDRNQEASNDAPERVMCGPSAGGLDPHRRKALTAERLREVLWYDRETGEFVWLLGLSPRIRVGSRAGCADLNGYRAIKIDGVIYRSHRLAWLWVTGAMPAGMIDHIDGDRSNNRLGNLRVVDNSTNMENQRRVRPDSRSGLMGVRLHHRGYLWEARIKVKGKSIFIGLFDTAEKASAAYIDSKRRLHAGNRL